MRFAMFMREGKKGIAVSRGEGFHGLTKDIPGYPGDLGTILERGALEAAGTALLSAPAVDLDSAVFLPPILRPGKILCVGLNYADHAAEVGFEAPAHPTIFCRFPSSLVGHGQPMIKPVQSREFDYEAELAVIIGKRGRHIREEDALEHVAGYSLFNDGSVRDFQFLSSQWTLAKNFDATGAFGPWMVTPDELPQGGRGLDIATRLNGQVMQDSNTRNMMFDVIDLIRRLSAVMTLEPGDVLITGTPAGVGISRKPPVFMKPGDVIEVEIQGIGILRNPIANEDDVYNR